MGDQKKPDKATRAEQLEAQFRMEEERAEKITRTVEKAMGDVTARVSKNVERYKTESAYKKMIDTLRTDDGKSVFNQIYELSVLNLRDKEEPYISDTLAQSAINGLCKPAGISAEEAAASEEVAALKVFLSDKDNTRLNRATLLAALKEISAQLSPTAPVPASATKPKTAAPKASPATAAPIEPVVPDNEAWGAATGINFASPPATNTPIDLAIKLAPENKVPPVDTAESFFSNVGSSEPAKSNQKIEDEVKKLRRDVRKIHAVCELAQSPAAVYEYKQSFGDSGNKKYLSKLAEIAKDVEDGIKVTAVRYMAKGEKAAKISVDDSNRGEWQALLEKETIKLHAALNKFEGAEFSAKKQRTPALARIAREKIATEMRKTFTEECTTTTTDSVKKDNIEPLAEAITPPSLFEELSHKYAKKVLSGTAVLVLGLAGLGVYRGMRDTGEAPTQPVAVAQNNVAPPPKQAVEPKKAEEAPKAPVLPSVVKVDAPPKEMLPPPREVAAEPKPDPVVVVPMGKAAETPMGKNEKDLRDLFEKSVMKDFVLANPRVVQRGFFKEKDGNLKINDNYKISYLPQEDITRGIYVLHNEFTGATLLIPPANKKAEIAIVQNRGSAKGKSMFVDSFHISILVDGKEIVLKDQNRKAIDFKLPMNIPANKFLSGDAIDMQNSPMIECAARYLGGKDELNDSLRINGSEAPTIRPKMLISGHGFGVHSGVILDFNDLTLNENKATARVSSSNPRYESGEKMGVGDSSDVVVRVYKNKQEPEVRTGRIPFAADLIKGPIVANEKGGLDLDGKFNGIAAPLPIGGYTPLADNRQLPTASTSPRGGALLWVLPEAEASFRSRQGNGEPVSLKDGAPANNQQAGRAKLFTEEVENTLQPTPDKTYTLPEFAASYLRATRMIAQIDWVRKEAPRAHARTPQMTPGAFGPAIIGLKKGDTAERFSGSGLALVDINKPDGPTWLDATDRAAKALLDRSVDKDQLTQTQKEAAKSFNEAQKILADAGKIKDADKDADKAEEKKKLLGQVFDKEVEAARLLGIKYPQPFLDTDDEKVTKAKQEVQRNARTIMKNMLAKKPEAMLQYFLEQIHLPREKAANVNIAPENAVQPDDMDMGMLGPMDRFRDKLHDRALSLNKFEIGTVTRLFSDESPFLEQVLTAKTNESAAALLSTHLHMSSSTGKTLAEKLSPGVNNTDNKLRELVEAFRDGIQTGDIKREGFSRTDIADLSRSQRTTAIG